MPDPIMPDPRAWPANPAPPHHPARPSAPPPPSPVSTAFKVIIGILLVMFAAAALVPIGGAVIAPGRVEEESRVKRVAHPTGGIVAEILVANGDRVAKDQPLVRLDNLVTSVQDQMTGRTVEHLLAEQARLDAERLGRDGVAFPAELLASTSSDARTAMADEAHLFALRRTEIDQQRLQLQLRMEQYGQQITGIQAQMGGYAKQRRLITPELRSVRELWDNGLVTISRLNQLERTAADLDATLGSAQAQVAQARAKISETQQQLITLDQTRRAEAGQQFAQISTALNDQRMRRAAANQAERHSLIRAPAAGHVGKLALTAAGDVVRPGEILLEIVPDEDRLTVTLTIAPGDIDQVQVGQSARIRFTAFNSTASPEMAGKLVYVAAERTTDGDSGLSFYEARVTVDRADLAENPDMQLKPGMPAEVYIQTGSRSMLSYLTKPLRDQLARAFRDN